MPVNSLDIVTQVHAIAPLISASRRCPACPSTIRPFIPASDSCPPPDQYEILQSLNFLVSRLCLVTIKHHGYVPVSIHERSRALLENSDFLEVIAMTMNLSLPQYQIMITKATDTVEGDAEILIDSQLTTLLTYIIPAKPGKQKKNYSPSHKTGTGAEIFAFGFTLVHESPQMRLLPLPSPAKGNPYQRGTPGALNLAYVGDAVTRYDIVRCLRRLPKALYHDVIVEDILYAVQSNFAFAAVCSNAGETLAKVEPQLEPKDLAQPRVIVNEGSAFLKRFVGVLACFGPKEKRWEWRDTQFIKLVRFGLRWFPPAENYGGVSSLGLVPSLTATVPLQALSSSTSSASVPASLTSMASRLSDLPISTALHLRPYSDVNTHPSLVPRPPSPEVILGSGDSLSFFDVALARGRERASSSSNDPPPFSLEHPAPLSVFSAWSLRAVSKTSIPGPSMASFALANNADPSESLAGSSQGYFSASLLATSPETSSSSNGPDAPRGVFSELDGDLNSSSSESDGPNAPRGMFSGLNADLKGSSSEFEGVSSSADTSSGKDPAILSAAIDFTSPPEPVGSGELENVADRDWNRSYLESPHRDLPSPDPLLSTPLPASSPPSAAKRPSVPGSASVDNSGPLLGVNHMSTPEVTPPHGLLNTLVQGISNVTLASSPESRSSSQSSLSDMAISPSTTPSKLVAGFSNLSLGSSYVKTNIALDSTNTGEQSVAPSPTRILNCRTSMSTSAESAVENLSASSRTGFLFATDTSPVSSLAPTSSLPASSPALKHISSPTVPHPETENVKEQVPRASNRKEPAVIEEFAVDPSSARDVNGPGVKGSRPILFWLRRLTVLHPSTIPMPSPMISVEEATFTDYLAEWQRMSGPGAVVPPHSLGDPTRIMWRPLREDENPFDDDTSVSQ